MSNKEDKNKYSSLKSDIDPKNKESKKDKKLVKSLMVLKSNLDLKLNLKKSVTYSEFDYDRKGKDNPKSNPTENEEKKASLLPLNQNT